MVRRPIVPAGDVRHGFTRQVRLLARCAGEQVREPAAAAGGALALARAQRGRFPPASRRGRRAHPGYVAAAAPLRLGAAASVGGHRFFAPGAAWPAGHCHRLGATSGRIGRVEPASMAGDDAIELGERLDLINDDAAHLGGAFRGFLRQLEDAFAQLCAR